jgi:transposase
MSVKRRSFEPEFKLQCVLDVLSGRKIPSQVCRENGLNESILARWRKQFAEHAPKIFANSKGNGVSAEAQRIAELERLVGRLTLELDASKKLSSYLTYQ